MTQLEQLKQECQDLTEESQIIYLVKLEDYVLIMAGKQAQTEEFKSLVTREYQVWVRLEAVKKEIKKLERQAYVKSLHDRGVTVAQVKRVTSTHYNPREYYG